MKTLSLKAALAAITLTATAGMAQAAGFNEICKNADRALQEKCERNAYICESVDSAVNASFSINDTSSEKATGIIENLMGKTHKVDSGYVLSYSQSAVRLNHGIYSTGVNKHDANMVNYRIHRLQGDGEMDQFDGIITLNLANPRIHSTLYMAVLKPVELACERISNVKDEASYNKFSKYVAERKEKLEIKAFGLLDKDILEFQEKVRKAKEQMNKNNTMLQEIKQMSNELDAEDSSDEEGDGQPTATDYPARPEQNQSQEDLSDTATESPVPGRN